MRRFVSYIAPWVAVVALLAAFFAQSYNSRRDLASAQRKECRISSVLHAYEADALEAQLAVEVALADSRRTSRTVRLALERESALQRITLDRLWQVIDPRDIHYLDAAGRRYIHSLMGRTYSCERLFPSPSLIQFWHS
jgi:type II secretory pathway pseudopilin PulG